jgi:hypothetical protein
MARSVPLSRFTLRVGGGSAFYVRRTTTTMSHTALIFGSSKDLLSPYWRVWSYDDETKTPIPLGHFKDKARSDTAAFDLAHSAGSVESPDGMDAILASKDSPPAPLPPKISVLLATLAEDAIRMSEAAEPGKSKVTVRHTPDDTVYVVRFSTCA